jgi:uncharacterized membrane protein
MWDRGILKSNAKLALRGRYWTAFAVCLVALLISEALNIFTMPIQIQYQFLAFNPLANQADIMAQSGVTNLISVGNLLLGIFVGLPLEIGLARFFVQNRFGRTDFGTLFSGFRQNYGNGVGALFVTNLFIGLWSLLLIIPGIVKALQYSMVSYILSDNPSIPGSRAREISRMMTNGEKGAIFVLILSFLGWFLLGAICFGVGILFVIPYYNATMSELYVFLRDRAIQTGQLNPAELGLVVPAPYSQDQQPQS